MRSLSWFGSLIESLNFKLVRRTNYTFNPGKYLLAVVFGIVAGFFLFGSLVGFVLNGMAHLTGIVGYTITGIMVGALVGVSSAFLHGLSSKRGRGGTLIDGEMQVSLNSSKGRWIAVPLWIPFAVLRGVPLGILFNSAIHHTLPVLIGFLTGFLIIGLVWWLRRNHQK